MGININPYLCAKKKKPKQYIYTGKGLQWRFSYDDYEVDDYGPISNIKVYNN